jgi:hypothetical protein
MMRALHTSNVNIDPKLVDNYDMKKDYLNICNDLSVVEMLIEKGDTDPLGACLSDDVYVFSSLMKRKRVQIVVTKSAFYLFSNKKIKSNSGKSNKSSWTTKWKLIKYYKLKDLKQVVISSKNYTLAAFIFDKDHDFLMDSCRRTEIISYICRRMKEASLNMFKILYLKSFDFIDSSKKLPENKSKIESLENSLLGSTGQKIPSSRLIDSEVLQDTFKNAKISGYLKLMKVEKSIFSTKKIFKEYFFILSNLGLIYFKKFGVSH